MARVRTNAQAGVNFAELGSSARCRSSVGAGMRGVKLAILAAALTAPNVATAGEVQRFEPARELNLLGLGGVDVATGWVPANSAIQVSFDMHVGDTLEAEMLGDAEYEWEDGELWVTGDPDGGLFAIDVGALLDARVRFDLLGQQWESELIGPYDLVVDGGTLFDPYLLPGNPTRPALIDIQTEPTEVYTYSLVDAIIASGELVVDAAFDVQVSLECASIEAAPMAGDPAWIVEELAPVVMPSPSADSLLLDATLRCTTTSTFVVLLYPSVQITLGLETFELAPFELPVPLLTDDVQAFDFEPRALEFVDVPTPTPADDDGGEGGADGETGDEPPVAEDSSGGQEPEPVGSDETGASEQDGEASGCACTSGRDGSAPALFLLVALAPRRRTRPR